MVGKVGLDSTFRIIQTVCRRSPYVSIPIGNLSQTVADHMQTRLKHCFQFLLGLTIVPRGNKNNTSAKFWGKNKECYGIFENGPLRLSLAIYDRRIVDIDRVIR